MTFTEKGEALPTKVVDLIAIGYWKSDLEPNLPHPREFQDNQWNLAEREMVIDHIKNARMVLKSRGFSWCRFECGINEMKMGTKCLTDGTYIFPEKLTHYLETHQVRLPKKFVDYVKKHEPWEEEYLLEVKAIDYSWWEKVSLKDEL